MRDELVYRLSASEAAALQVSLETLERFAAQRGCLLSRDVAVLKRDLAAFVGRAARHVDATTRLPHGEGRQDDDDEQLIDTAEAARVLGITEDSVRKRCRTGIFMTAARQVRGRWMIPMSDVESAERSA